MTKQKRATDENWKKQKRAEKGVGKFVPKGEILDRDRAVKLVLTAERRDRLQDLAEAGDLTPAELVRQVMSEWLDEQQGEA